MTQRMKRAIEIYRNADEHLRKMSLDNDKREYYKGVQASALSVLAFGD